MKILFFGDSITDALRDREHDFWLGSYGCGFVRDLTVRLMNEDAGNKIYNRGISGDKITDLNARIQQDVWDVEPDLISMLVGVNDVWHKINDQNGTPIEQFEQVYSNMITETKQKLPNAKIVLLEPFVLKGNATQERYSEFVEVFDFAKVVKALAKKHDLPFITLQKKLNKLTENTPTHVYLSDGVHPTVLGAKVIADEWWKWYKKQK